jgi:diphthine synthase
MGKLVLIGLGIWDEGDLSLNGLRELERSDVIFAEQYTSRMKEKTIESISRKIGKKIHLLAREEVENQKILLEEAKNKNVALLIPGDPLISTTHISLKLSAEKIGIETKTIHSSSIFTAAIGECGLQVYKFGNSCTLAFWSEKYKPKSNYDVLYENKKRGLHSLVFLDIGERCMDAKEALELLMKIEKEKKKGVAKKNSFAVVLSRVGSEEQKITYGKIEELLKAELGKPPFILIIPGKLHFVEEEALGKFKVN